MATKPKLTLTDLARELELYTNTVPQVGGVRMNKSDLRFGQLIINKYDVSHIVTDDGALYNKESTDMVWIFLYYALMNLHFIETKKDYDNRF